mmetsp:Transcript_4929/g.7445  ORF Transcript_4929/g.7445 Transcript_4929/m.7445 type:complete len:85 (-) Transcript_4929:883-1137(-)
MLKEMMRYLVNVSRVFEIFDIRDFSAVTKITYFDNKAAYRRWRNLSGKRRSWGSCGRYIIRIGITVRLKEKNIRWFDITMDYSL